jgi:hypothetical protein
MFVGFFHEDIFASIQQDELKRSANRGQILSGNDDVGAFPERCRLIVSRLKKAAYSAAFDCGGRI